MGAQIKAVLAILVFASALVLFLNADRRVSIKQAKRLFPQVDFDGGCAFVIERWRWKGRLSFNSVSGGQVVWYLMTEPGAYLYSQGDEIEHCGRD